MFPVSMLGNGFYAGNSDIQQEAVLQALGIIHSAKGWFRPTDKVLTVVDYGACEGSNSILPLSHALDCCSVDQRPTDWGTELVEIQYILSDTPNNDYCSLAKTLHNAIEQWGKEYPNVRIFPQMVGRSFYEQIVPTSSVHLGYTFSCLQWLSDAPPPHTHGDIEHENIAAKLHNRQAACKDQSHKDLHQFLRVRAKEFRIGGTLILCFVGSSGPLDYWSNPVFASLASALDEMINEGLVPVTLASLFFPPAYPRTLHQVQDVVQAKSIRSAWLTHHLSAVDIEHPLSREQSARVNTCESSVKYAEAMIEFALAINANFLINALRSQIETDGVDDTHELELVSRWKTKAVQTFLSEYRDAKVVFRWVYVRLERVES